MTVFQWLMNARKSLEAEGFEASTLEAQLLLKHSLGVERSWLFSHPDSEIETDPVDELLRRRKSHEPLAYILGRREFYGREFEVTPAVLIPRQETELLVDVAKDFANQNSAEIRVLDIGTGSGCIAITVAKEFPKAEVWALDISESAIAVAERNADLLGAAVRFIRSDTFEGLLDQQFDLILSNPPYIGLTEPLAKEVSEYEPHLALFAGDDGLDLYRRIAAESKHHLRPQGWLAVEVGYKQAATVAEILTAEEWEISQILKDLAGIPRVVVCHRAKSGIDIT